MKKRILYLQYTNPTSLPPLERSATILADRKWKVMFFGIKSAISGNFSFSKHENIDIELMDSCDGGVKQKIHYFKYLIGSLKIVKKFKPDWIYVSDYLAIPVGFLLKGFGFRVVYHEHDSPSKRRNNSIFIRFLFILRNLFARKVDLIIIPQRDRGNIFRNVTATTRPINIVWNCPSKREILPLRVPEIGPKDPDLPLKIYFHGSINLDRVPISLVDACGRCSFPTSLKIVGYETVGSQGVTKVIRAAAQDVGEGLTVDLPGSFQNHDDLLDEMKDMDVGWICFLNRGSDINLNHLAGASNKAFEYLAAGMPLIVNNESEWERIFVSQGFALSCNPNDRDSIAQTLAWFQNHPVKATEMGARGRRMIEKSWNYENQFAPVIEKLEESYSP